MTSSQGARGFGPASSTGADREQRRARHAQRVSRSRAARERQSRTSVVSQLADPFAAIQQDAALRAAEEVFPL